jgi:HPt (histidine-containing phosphotransfer) domain-containing protein
MANNIIDMDVIEGLKEVGDQDFLIELIDLFLNQARELMVSINNAQKINDLTTINKDAHKLKGSCLNLGANQMGEICHKLETNAKENNTEIVNELINTLQSVSTETFSEITKLK